jgi:hypothetical protein
MPKSIRGKKNISPDWVKWFIKYIWSKRFLRHLGLVLLALVIFASSTMYGIGQWYIHKHQKQPLVLGASFVPDYAESFGLDPMETLNAMLSDLHLKQVRLVSYWKDIEKSPGNYDFSQLDQEFALANKYGVKISLAVGLRQPRWPECHEPEWINIDPKAPNTWQPQLYKFMHTVIDRYKDNPALSEYELENEFFMKVFGECKDFNRYRLIFEDKLLKKWDPSHPIVISRSDNWIGIPVYKPTPNEFAISIYKRVWDAGFTHRYFEYPIPAWYYAFLAGAEEIYSGKDMIIHELQAEPWTPNGKQITEISVKEMYKSMNPQRLKDRIDYGESTGMRTIDLWGAEWWYWMKVKQHNPDVWNVVKVAAAQAAAKNQKLAHN